MMAQREETTDMTFYLQRFSVMAIIVFILSMIYAVIFGNTASILTYIKWISFGLFLMGGILVTNQDTSSSYDLAGKSASVFYGGSSLRASDDGPIIGNKEGFGGLGGITSYLFYGGMIVLFVAFVLDWII